MRIDCSKLWRENRICGTPLLPCQLALTVRAVLLTHKVVLPEICRCGKDKKTQTKLRSQPRGNPCRHFEVAFYDTSSWQLWLSWFAVHNTALGLKMSWGTNILGFNPKYREKISISKNFSWRAKFQNAYRFKLIALRAPCQRKVCPRTSATGCLQGPYAM